MSKITLQNLYNKIPISIESHKVARDVYDIWMVHALTKTRLSWMCRVGTGDPKVIEYLLTTVFSNSHHSNITSIRLDKDRYRFDECVPSVAEMHTYMGRYGYACVVNPYMLNVMDLGKLAAAKYKTDTIRVMHKPRWNRHKAFPEFPYRGILL